MNLLCVGVGGWIFEALMKLIVFRKKEKEKKVVFLKDVCCWCNETSKFYVRLFNCFSAITRVQDIEKGPAEAASQGTHPLDPLGDTPWDTSSCFRCPPAYIWM